MPKTPRKCLGRLCRKGFNVRGTISKPKERGMQVKTIVFDPHNMKDKSGYIQFISFDRLIRTLKAAGEFGPNNEVLKISMNDSGIELHLKDFT